MYKRVDWMKAADQSILQLLGGPQRLDLTTSNIARNTGLNPSYTSERLSVLVKHDLVEKDEESGSHPFYAISDRGLKAVQGEIPPEELTD
jgi:DNA-binding transcriptional ArsR family regulator